MAFILQLYLQQSLFLYTPIVRLKYCAGLVEIDFVQWFHTERIQTMLSCINPLL